MIDLTDIGKYRENNRIEAKRATGGFPHSLWETYSAFANTIGGVILLGVEERPDHSLVPVGLPDPPGTLAQLWQGVNDPAVVSVNVLRESDVRLTPEGVLAVEVPRADRHDRPVYVGSDPLRGSYRRNGEGDYHCTEEEVRGMLRDREDFSPDLEPIPGLPPGSLHGESVLRFRQRMASARPGHLWEKLPDTEFLLKLRALARVPGAGLRPTAAGLLLLGREPVIRMAFPEYRLCCRDERECVSSGDGNWSGNLLDFHERVLTMAGGWTGDPEVRDALGKAVENALIHADYRIPGGILAERRGETVEVSDPGILRPGREEALSGVSDPRNAGLSRMFSLAGIGAGAGEGLYAIHRVWRERGWSRPVLTESFQPDRTLLRLQMRPAGGAGRVSPEDRRRAVTDYLTERAEASLPELGALLGIPDPGPLLKEMEAEGLAEETPRGAFRLRR